MNLQGEDRGGKFFAEAGDTDATLRVIAELPAPEGLEDRVKAALRKAPAGHVAKMLEWPARSWTQSAWVRGAAAAAIVAVVAGGSWGVYARVQPRQTPLVIPHVGGSGGFASANAVRTPKTLDAPTVTPSLHHDHALAKKQAEGKKKASRSEKSDKALTSTK